MDTEQDIEVTRVSVGTWNDIIDESLSTSEFKVEVLDLVAEVTSGGNGGTLWVDKSLDINNWKSNIWVSGDGSVGGDVDNADGVRDSVSWEVWNIFVEADWNFQTIGGSLEEQ